MVGRKPVNQTAEPFKGSGTAPRPADNPDTVRAIQGEAGRLEAAPEGDLYVRDPIAARAKAIRDRVALYREQKREVPAHLQALLDALPGEVGSEVELVDAVTGDHVAEVEVDAGTPQPSGVASGTNTGVYTAEAPVKVEAPPEKAAEPEKAVEAPTPKAVVPEIKFTQAAGDMAATQAEAIARAAAKAAEDAKAEKETAAAAPPKKRGRPPRATS